MTSPLENVLSRFAEQAWSSAVAHHGSLGVANELYVSRVLSVTRRHLGARLSIDAAFDFINGLHTVDLYLAVGCSQPSDAAWERFDRLYRAFMSKVACVVCHNSDTAHEIAGSIPGHIFLPGASGYSRIATYEGRSSLATWIAAIINNKALREHRSSALWERFDEVPEMADCEASERTQRALRAQEYASLMRESVTAAGNSLDERERLMLALRYRDGLGGAEIAGILGLHPSIVSRRLAQIHEKLKDNTISILRSKYKLHQFEIEECVDCIRDDPSSSILTLIKIAS